ILGVVSLMAHLYLDESSPKSVSFRVFSIEEVESFFEAQRNGVTSETNFGRVYEELGGVVSTNGFNLFLELTSAKKTGACTAAEALKHPFFAEGREQDPQPGEPKERLLFS
ncbi:MAG: uncharacterized protein A8A55_2164, partial [Amphiamblys sp. WSBS2006]